MIYPFLTLPDGTEIVHSELHADETVTVHIERPDAECCFRTMTCILPTYEIREVCGFSEDEVNGFVKMIRSSAHLIIQFAREGGFENASSF